MDIGITNTTTTHKEGISTETHQASDDNVGILGESIKIMIGNPNRNHLLRLFSSICHHVRFRGSFVGISYKLQLALEKSMNENTNLLGDFIGMLRDLQHIISRESQMNRSIQEEILFLSFFAGGSMFNSSMPTASLISRVRQLDKKTAACLFVFPLWNNHTGNHSFICIVENDGKPDYIVKKVSQVILDREVLEKRKTLAKKFDEVLGHFLVSYVKWLTQKSYEHSENRFLLCLRATSLYYISTSPIYNSQDLSAEMHSKIQEIMQNKMLLTMSVREWADLFDNPESVYTKYMGRVVNSSSQRYDIDWDNIVSSSIFHINESDIETQNETLASALRLYTQDILFDNRHGFLASDMQYDLKELEDLAEERHFDFSMPECHFIFLIYQACGAWSHEDSFQMDTLLLQPLKSTINEKFKNILHDGNTTIPTHIEDRLRGNGLYLDQHVRGTYEAVCRDQHGLEGDIVQSAMASSGIIQQASKKRKKTEGDLASDRRGKTRRVHKCASITDTAENNKEEEKELPAAIMGEEQLNLHDSINSQYLVSNAVKDRVTRNVQRRRELQGYGTFSNSETENNTLAQHEDELTYPTSPSQRLVPGAMANTTEKNTEQMEMVATMVKKRKELSASLAQDGIIREPPASELSFGAIQGRYIPNFEPVNEAPAMTEFQCFSPGANDVESNSNLTTPKVIKYSPVKEKAVGKAKRNLNFDENYEAMHSDIDDRILGNLRQVADEIPSPSSNVNDLGEGSEVQSENILSGLPKGRRDFPTESSDQLRNKRQKSEEATDDNLPLGAEASTINPLERKEDSSYSVNQQENICSEPLDKQLKLTEEERQRFQRVINELHAKCDDLNKELENNRYSSAEEKMQLKKSERELKELKLEYTKLEAEKKDENISATKEKEQLLKNYENQLNEWQFKYKTLEEENRGYEELIRDKDILVSKAEVSLKDLNEKYERAQENREREQDFHRREKERFLMESEEQLSKLKEDQIKAQEKLLYEKEQAISEMTAEGSQALFTFREQSLQRENILLARLEDLTRLATISLSEKNTEAMKLQDSLNESETTIRELIDQNVQLKGELAEMNKELVQEKKQNKLLRESVQENLERVSESENERLQQNTMQGQMQKKIDDLSKWLKESEEETDKLREEVNELTDSRQLTTEKNKKLMRNKDEERKKEQTLHREQMISVEDELRETKAQLHHLEETLKLRRQEIYELKDNIKHHNHDMGELLIRIENMTDMMRENDDLIKSLRKDIKTKDIQLEDLSNEKLVSHANIQSETEICHLNHSLEETQGRIRLLAKELEVKENANLDLRNELNKQNQRLSVISKENQSLRKEMDHVRKNAEEKIKLWTEAVNDKFEPFLAHDTDLTEHNAVAEKFKNDISHMLSRHFACIIEKTNMTPSEEVKALKTYCDKVKEDLHLLVQKLKYFTEKDDVSKKNAKFVADLQAECQNLREKLRSIEREKAMVIKELDDMKSTVVIEHKKIESLMKITDELEHENKENHAKYNLKVSSMLHENNKLKANIKDEQERYNELMDILETRENEIEKKSAHILQQSNENMRLQKTVRQLGKEKRLIEEQINVLSYQPGFSSSDDDAEKKVRKNKKQLSKNNETTNKRKYLQKKNHETIFR